MMNNTIVVGDISKNLTNFQIIRSVEFAVACTLPVHSLIIRSV